MRYGPLPAESAESGRGKVHQNKASRGGWGFATAARNGSEVRSSNETRNFRYGTLEDGCQTSNFWKKAKWFSWSASDS